MRKLALFAATTLAAISTPAFAVAIVNPPTLHGFCSVSTPCTDNGTNTPTGVNPAVFGFSAGGHSATGSLLVDILVPNNVAIPTFFTISGALLGSSTYTASLFSTTAWTSGELDDYLGIAASPTNPIGAFLPSTQNPYQPTATGFYVFQANVGTVTLPSNSGAGDSFLMQLGGALAPGSYVVAYLNQSGQYGATANSGAILETTTAVPEPATWAMMLIGFGATGFAMRRRRRKPILAQLA